MFLKINKDSALFAKLHLPLIVDFQRHFNFLQWQVENLPDFNGDVLKQSNVYYLYPEIVGWKFSGEVDKRLWKPVRGHDGYYAPNKRTKEGEKLSATISDVRGKRFDRWDFFSIFKIDHFLPARFFLPYGFCYGDIVYMDISDRFYQDIRQNWEGEYEEISYGEWRRNFEAYIKEAKKKLGDVCNH